MTEPDEMFSNCTRSAGDLAGVFEFDGDVGFLYLYSLNKEEGQKVLEAICILSDPPDFSEADVEIRWNSTESNVGLFIRGELWAVIGADALTKFGGNYKSKKKPEIPFSIATEFS